MRSPTFLAEAHIIIMDGSVGMHLWRRRVEVNVNNPGDKHIAAVMYGRISKYFGV